MEASERLWREQQADLTTLLPHSRQIFAEESGHYIQLEQPDLVIDAIADVIEAVRDPNTWVDSPFRALPQEMAMTATGESAALPPASSTQREALLGRRTSASVLPRVGFSTRRKARARDG